MLLGAIHFLTFFVELDRHKRLSNMMPLPPRITFLLWAI